MLTLKRGTSNYKLSGGKFAANVWVINPTDTYDTCPTTCQHLPRKYYDIAVENGEEVSPTPSFSCYANSRVKLQAIKGEQLTHAETLVAVINDMPTNGLLRWAEVGDVLGSSVGALNMLRAIHMIRPDITIIAYTHAWKILAGVGSDIFRASVETTEDKLHAESLGYRTALTVGSDATARSVKSISGDKVFVCPATIWDNRNCENCRACEKSDNSVAFPAHGIAKGRVDILDSTLG